MLIDELKKIIEQRTGVPASLLTGETAEENVAIAKAVLAFRREHEQQRPKSTREQFADWLGEKMGEDVPQDEAGVALAEIEEAARVDAGGYPMVKDGQADISNMPDGRPAREQFADWLGKQTQFNPFKDNDGWERIF